MKANRYWLFIGLAVIAPWARADSEPYKVDESKLPEWVKRLGDSPYRVIMDSTTVHVHAPARAASGSASKKAQAKAAVASAAMAAPPVAASTDRGTPATSSREPAPAPAAQVATREATIAPPAVEAAAQPPAALLASTGARSDRPEAPSPPRAPTIGQVCPRQTAPKMPEAAADQRIGGTVRTRVVVQAGKVQDVTILSGPSIFHAAVRRAMKTYQCEASEAPVTVEQDFVFDVD